MSQPPTVPRLDQACFLVLCRDADGNAHLREENLNGHLSHVEQHWQRYITAGPLREPGETKLCGSFFLVLADSLDEAREIMSGDPYISCGLYAEVEYLAFTPAIGQFLGGKIWESAETLRDRATGG